MNNDATHLKIKNGFGNRVWLTSEQWETYRRCAPVRYVRKALEKALKKKDKNVCAVCHEKSDPISLTASHIIPFQAGIVDWGLTPDWLNSISNLKLAHKKTCNKAVSLSPNEVAEKLVNAYGFDLGDSPAVRSGLLQVERIDGAYSVSFTRT